LQGGSFVSDAGDMNDFQEDRRRRDEEFARHVRTKGIRREKGKRPGKASLIFGLGMFGLVGWSIAIPTLIGIALGVWIDSRWPSQYSWTLMMLFIGVILGCLNAWYWVRTMLGIRGRRRRTHDL